MSILDRLNRLVRANLNDAMKRSDERSVRSALDEMEKSLREAKRQQAEMRRDERELIESIRSARNEADEWEERAILALQKEDEDLAREALKVKNQKLARADDLREELRDHRSHMEDIQASLEALETKLQSQKERISTGSGRRRSSGRDRRARDWDRKLEDRRNSERSTGTDEPPTEYDESFRTDETFETFDRMTGKIESMEAEIEAMRELSGEPGDSKRARLERIFRKMENRTDYERTEQEVEEERRGRDRKESGQRDDLGEMKRRMDRLSELKEKFGDDEESDSS